MDHPPDITITREDVLALPLLHTDPHHEDGPPVGWSWHLAQSPSGRLLWVEVPVDTPLAARGASVLRRASAELAERAYLWRTALATDAALADMAADATDITATATRIAELRGELARLVGKAHQA